MQDVLVNAFSKEVHANTEVTHFFPQRTISLNVLGGEAQHAGKRNRAGYF
jgi:hypothetical protein